MNAELSEELPRNGYLQKWASYVKGYKRRWFVLADGHLTYYNNEKIKKPCRGTMSLKYGRISSSSLQSFTVANGKQTYHIRAQNDVDGKTWQAAIQSAIDVETMESDVDNLLENIKPGSISDELLKMTKAMNNTAKELKLYGDVIPKHWDDIELLMADWQKKNFKWDTTQLKDMEEKSAIFRLTALSMVNKYCSFEDLAQNSLREFKSYIKEQNEQRERLVSIIQSMAEENLTLERKFNISKRRTTYYSLENDDSEDEMYFDALQLYPTRISGQTLMDDALHQESDSSSTEEESERLPKLEDTKEPIVRRMRIPKRPDQSVQLWSFLKDVIGQDLANVLMPIQFAEPITMLQRLAEEFEYSNVLDKAAECEDSSQQLAYLAAFVISAYSSTTNRFTKPFNPILGETYELDRTKDLGWRCISESVSYQPRIYAQHCEGKGWTTWQQFTLTAKFGGNYLEMTPAGRQHIFFENTKNHFEWSKVKCRLNNVIVGSLWLEHFGKINIENSGKNLCELKFHRYSFFREDPKRKITGWVKNDCGDFKWYISGRWDESIDIAPVLNSSGEDSPKFETGPELTAWEANPPLEGSEDFYNFSAFTCQLNQMEKDVAPTDSRLRPDQRYMEDGHWAKAMEEKTRLIEKQRAVVKLQEEENNVALERGEVSKVYEPKWFQKIVDPETDEVGYEFRGEYWTCKGNQDWSRCPNLF